MPSFQYRALTQSGELVSGSISAPTAAEVANRIEYLGLVPIDTVSAARERGGARFSLSMFSQPKAEDVTVFTRDLALLLKAGARIDDALDLLAADIDIGRLRPVVAQIRGRVMAGESFSEALHHHPALFPPMYLALVRVGETSGALDRVLDVLGAERSRGEAMRRKVADALRYPLFVLCAATAVLGFFLLFVLPQFAAVLEDFHAKLDPIVAALFGLSKFVRTHIEIIEASAALTILAAWLLLRRAGVRGLDCQAGWRGCRCCASVTRLHRTALFCRNLGVLLGSGVALPMTLAHPGRHARRHRCAALEQNRRPRAPRRQAVGRAHRQRGAAADGDPHVAYRRGNGSVAGAGRQYRRILRGQAAAQPRPYRRFHRTAGDHRHQHGGRRAHRVHHDRIVVGHADRHIRRGQHDPALAKSRKAARAGRLHAWSKSWW